MKSLLYTALLFLGVACHAQTTYVSLFTVNNTNATLAVSSNSLVSIVGLPLSNVPKVYGYCALGGFPMAQGSVYTGLTNIAVQAVNGSLQFATLSITAPSSGVVSNYVPANAVVIPSTVTGNVQVMLESSTDLVNWTAASPGTYGPASATNRFFRVRAAVQ